MNNRAVWSHARGEIVYGITPSEHESTRPFECRALFVVVCVQHRIFNLPEDCLITSERTHMKEGEADHVNKVFDSLFSQK